VNLNHLRAFVKVVQTRSYKEAGALLSVSQPAITQRIQALEEHLQTRLILRQADGIQLTAPGESVLTQAQVILNVWDELERQLLGGKLKGKLTVGASTIPSEYLLPAILKKYRTDYPDVFLQMRISGSHEVTKWLEERTVELCITGEPEKHADFVTYPIFEDQLQIIAPLGRQWTEKIETFADLFDVEWVLREQQSDTRQAWEKELQRRGCESRMLKISSLFGSTDAVLAAVEEGMGISVISSLAANRALEHNRVQVIQLDELSITRHFYVSCLRENAFSPLISSFMSSLKEFQFKGKKELLI